MPRNAALAALAALSMLAASCGEPGAAGTESVAQSRAGRGAVAPPRPEDVDGAPPARAAPKPDESPIAAPGLGGHDRFIALRPFKTVAAVDFELGPLARAGADPRLAAFEALAKALKAGRLEAGAFTAFGAALASAAHGQGVSAMGGRLRFSQPAERNGGLFVSFRLLGEDRSYAGRAALYPDAQGVWLVEFVEFDEPKARYGRASGERGVARPWRPPLDF